MAPQSEAPHATPYRKHVLPLGFAVLVGSYAVQFVVAVVLLLGAALVLGSTDALGTDVLTMAVEACLALYAVGALALLGGREAVRLRRGDLARGARGSVYAIVFSLVLGAWSLAGSLASGAEPLPAWPVELVKVLAFCVMVGVFEEGVFRGAVLGCLLPRMGATRRGVVGAVLLSTLVFGLAHVTFGTELSPVVVAQLVLKLVQSGILGFFFASLAVSTGSVWPAALTHFVWDFALMGSTCVFQSPFDTSYVDTSSDGMALVAFYVVMIVFQLPLVVSGARRLARVDHCFGWLAREGAPDGAVGAQATSPVAEAAPVAGAETGASVDGAPGAWATSAAGPVPPAWPPAPERDIAPAGEPERGSEAWWEARSPKAPPPPAGWRG